MVARSKDGARTIERLEKAVKEFAKANGYGENVWYGNAHRTLQFFLGDEPRTGVIVLSEADVGRLVAAGATSSEIAKLLADHSSGNYGVGSTRYDDDVYHRIGLLCSGAVQQLKRVVPDFHQDGSGVELDVTERGGSKRYEIVVTPEEIASVPRTSKISYFGRLLEICRQKIKGAAS